MSEEVSILFEIMQTTRSMRRLKPDPVPAALIRKVLEAGTFAPSGGNMQRWRFLVIRDAKIKQRRPDLTVMMVTAYGDDERRRRATEHGAAEFITKPVDFDHLKAQLSQLPPATG